VLYAAEGRPSIAPERLLRAALIQILFPVRLERQLMEQMQYNLLFRWFAGLGIDDPVWVPTVFTKKPRPALEHRHCAQISRRDPGR
jgi:transposase